MVSSLILVSLLATLSSAQRTNCTGVNAISPKCSSPDTFPYTRDFFYVGGRPLTVATGELTADKLYVEKITPSRGPYQSKPLVFSHGGGCTGATWLNTPDNRKGFAAYFVEKGYTVYIVDSVGLGRSAEADLTNFPMSAGSTAQLIEQGFTGVKYYNAYPQAQLHTQFPGSGRVGDPIFENFKKQLVPYPLNTTAFELGLRASGCALLELIGPSYLIAHSAGAGTNMMLSNDCPQYVAGNINLEGSTIPFYWYSYGTTGYASNPYGLTTTPLDYDPPISSPSELVVEQVGNATTALRQCYQQVEPARKLPKIAKVPYVQITSEASVHITYDHCIVNYLKQVGGNPEWIKLSEIGIRGNAHFMHLEKNNGQIADVVLKWIAKTERK
ncbi:alpha/beta-hydrolase [Dothidotthia symphoricarpi CBS 119687]|uniref:Alpha/beta-hydrolase n=1 Tax=Dothidotthia symphoricarpi CBS 119687 TaxID=1392245 RepID=A0A6A6A450_9PLEO|nr:alpha/beta-hydrolase [Dothidotthia symphoricarpi CBS 119687]KAF2125528.1 alpha/beta-hydrolase [Dothidotthia symphoricarpi CBS 119687]